MDALLPFLFGALVVAAIGLLAMGAYMSWHSTRGPAAERLARRLREQIGTGGPAVQQVSITKNRVYSSQPGLQRMLEQTPGIAALDRLLLQSGRSYNVGQLLAICVGAMLATVLLASVFALPWSARVALGLLALVLPLLDARRAAAKRLTRIEYQLPDALDMMSRAMRAGHAFPTTLKMIADEMAQPLSGEFKMVFDEVNFGVAMSDALMNMATRVPSTDLRYFVVAVLIQRETGGNLTELLAAISTIIRDRLKLLGQVRVLSAEGKMSAWVLGLLPVGAGIMQYLSNPDFIGILFTDPGGRKMLGGAVVMMIIGVFAITRITKIRV